MAVTINFYNKFIEYFGDNTIDLDGDTFKCELHNSLTFTATHTQRSNVSASALATGNGYTNPGQNLTSVTWVESSGVVTFDSADVSWTASGGTIGPATDAVIYSDTATNDELCWDVDFGESKSAGNGTDFKVVPDAAGWFTVSA